MLFLRLASDVIMLEVVVHVVAKVERGTTMIIMSTVKPPKKGHIGDGRFVLCREVVLLSEEGCACQ